MTADETIEAQGFVKHEGNDMPDCYGPVDLVDVKHREPYNKSYRIDAGAVGWCTVTHHRRHLSEREQIDMAIDEIEESADYYRSLERNALSEHKQNWANRAQQAEAILKLLQERQPS